MVRGACGNFTTPPGPPVGGRAENVSQALSIPLTPGWYAIVFGAGLVWNAFLQTQTPS